MPNLVVAAVEMQDLGVQTAHRLHLATEAQR